jgi:hypothetical protein
LFECPGSASHLEKYPLPETKYSAAGTKSHTVAEAICRGEDPYEIDCSPEDLEFAIGYAEVVKSVIDEVREETGEEPTVEFEHQISCEVDGELVGGTPDCLVYADEGPLHVIDAKAGFDYVEVKGNLQLRTYAYVAEKLSIFDSLHFHMYQPNCLGDNAHRRSDEGWAWVEDFEGKLRQTIAATKAKGEVYKSGEHCLYCNKPMCPLINQQLETSGVTVPAVKSLLPKLSEMDTERLLKMQDLAPLVASMAKQAGAILLERAKAGDDIPGRKLIKDEGNRDWKTGTPGPIPMAKKLGIDARDFYAPAKLLGPAPIEKAIKAKYKGKAKAEEREKYLAALAELVEKPDKGVKLVDAKAKGQAVTVAFNSEDDINDDNWE